MKTYRTIVADPPWDTSAGPRHWAARKPTHGNGSGKDVRYVSASRGLAYEPMDFEEICALPVPDLAAPDAHLYLWTINAYIEEAYAVAREWDFLPSTLLTWCKAPKGIGLGGTFTLATEHILFCRRGNLKALQRVDRNWWQWKRQPRHSQKPDALQDLIEQVSPGPYLELFARRDRLGWDTWGNESLGTADLPSLAA